MTEQEPQTTSEPIGPGQAAVSAFLSKEISLDQACDFVSHSIPQSFDEFVPRKYPQPSATLVDYIGSRNQGFVKRDPALAVTNGIWLNAVWEAFLANRHDMEFLEWAAERCKAAGSLDAATSIREHAAQYELNVFPESLYREGRAVQRADVDERMRGEPERRGR